MVREDVLIFVFHTIETINTIAVIEPYGFAWAERVFIVIDITLGSQCAGGAQGMQADHNKDSQSGQK